MLHGKKNESSLLLKDPYEHASTCVSGWEQRDRFQCPYAVEMEQDDAGSESTPLPQPQDEAELEDEEGEDVFPLENGGSEAPGLLLDPGSLTMVDRDTHSRFARNGPPSIATTQLASEVGSTVGAQKDAFLKSITFKRDEPSSTLSWGITFSDPVAARRGKFGQKKNRLYVHSIEGVLTSSRILEGDYLKSINGRKIGPSMNGPRAVERMKEVLENDGYLSITTANKELGDDILVQATIIKPRPNMTYEELGLVVWYWGYLCVKSIKKDSIFKWTAVKPVDHIVSINNIFNIFPTRSLTA